MFFRKLIKQNFYSYLLGKRKYISRAERILPSMVGSVFFVHNGRKFKRMSVVRSHIGLKFGEFSFTRRLIKHKIKRKKNK